MSDTAQAPSAAAGTIPARGWRRQPITVGELMIALMGYDRAMPVIVDGYEGGYDSLTIDNVSMTDIAVDITHPDNPCWGDHDDASAKHVLTQEGGPWGGKATDTRIDDPSGVAEGPALLLSRGDKR